jgi:hypothetical protein
MCLSSGTHFIIQSKRQRIQFGQENVLQPYVETDS